MRTRILPVVAALALVAAGCEDGTGVEDGAAVTVQFSAGTTTTASALSGARLTGQSASGLTLTGSNGVLTITEIRLIVAEVELEADEGACELAAGDDDAECPDFEVAPTFLDLPLGTGAVELATQVIPAGTYQKLEFEVEDIDLDEADEDEQELAAVRTAVLAAYPNWPNEASMVVAGSFDPTPESAGDERPFVVFFEAEIEVEKELVPALVVAEGQPVPDLTVNLLPSTWFVTSTGAVIDLSQWDFESTGAVAEFELDFESGVEIEEDDED